MAPRTRSIAKREQYESAYLHNSRGFAGLPTELLLRILSFMHGPIIPWLFQRPMPTLYRERRDLLRALCQVCHALRLTLLPILWERLEACTVHPSCRNENDRRAPELLAKEFFKHLKLIAGPNIPLAAYVKIVNVAVEPDYAVAGLSELAQSLSLLPNLRVVQIICRTPAQMIQPIATTRPQRTGNEAFHLFEKSFSGRCYSSVQKVSLPVEAKSVFACFPEAIDVYLNQTIFHGFSPYIEALAHHCPKVESFGWHETAPDWRIEKVIKLLPNLRRVQCCAFLTPDKITQLSELQNLETFALNIAGETFTQREINTIESAKRLLPALSQPNGRLELIFPSRVEVTTVGAR